MVKFLWEIFLLSQAGGKTEILLCGKFQDLCFLSKLMRKVRNQIFLQNVISKYFSWIFGRKNRPVWVLQATALWDACQVENFLNISVCNSKSHIVNKCSHRDSAPLSIRLLCRKHSVRAGCVCNLPLADTPGWKEILCFAGSFVGLSSDICARWKCVYCLHCEYFLLPLSLPLPRTVCVPVTCKGSYSWQREGTGS